MVLEGRWPGTHCKVPLGYFVFVFMKRWCNNSLYNLICLYLWCFLFYMNDHNKNCWFLLWYKRFFIMSRYNILCGCLLPNWYLPRLLQYSQLISHCSYWFSRGLNSWFGSSFSISRFNHSNFFKNHNTFLWFFLSKFVF